MSIIIKFPNKSKIRPFRHFENFCRYFAQNPENFLCFVIPRPLSMIVCGHPARAKAATDL